MNDEDYNKVTWNNLPMTCHCEHEWIELPWNDAVMYCIMCGTKMAFLRSPKPSPGQPPEKAVK